MGAITCLPPFAVDLQIFSSNFRRSHNRNRFPNQGDEMQKPQIRLIWIGFLVTALLAHAVAQGGATGAITGTVEDASGASIANAQVRITNQDTRVLERTVQTGGDGSFTAPLLPVGVYSLAISSAGFARRDFGDVVVRVTETTRLVAKLNPESVQQNI
jgi:hypothetical protein